MPMKLIPTMEEINLQFGSDVRAAMEAQNTEMLTEAVKTFATNTCKRLQMEHDSMTAAQRNDAAALAARGVRELTHAEKSYYEALATAMKVEKSGAQSALNDLAVAMPETVLDQVMADVQTEFPLLDSIDFVNSSYMTSWLYNKQEAQTASWSPVGGDIKGKLSGAFGKLSVTMCKLTAFMVVSMDYLDLGPAWLDRYVRAILTEACGMAMEEAIVSGAGNDGTSPSPIGMIYDLDKGNTAESGLTTYPKKEAIPVTALDPATYGSLIAKLAKTPTGRPRKVTGLILVVNPVDYYSKVMPATTVMVPGGGYAHDVLPVQTKIIQSTAVDEGEAAFGIGKQYIGALGASKVNRNSKNGIIDYDDSVQFLEDNRVYKIRLLGNGRPKDNNSFLRLDISGLKPLTYVVGTLGATAAAVSAAAEDGAEV